MRLHEALLLYLLSLKCYQRCIAVCKQLWVQGDCINNLVEIVQQCRSSYNTILKKAERLCVNLLAVDNHLFDGNVADIRKIIFEKAIDFVSQLNDTIFKAV